MLHNVREEWREADLVMTICSITVGVNYDYSPTNHPEWMFHKVYIHATVSSHNLVRDIFQSQMRVRHLRDNELHYFLDPTPTGCRLLETREQIKQRVLEMDSAGDRLYRENNARYEKSEQLWTDLWVDALAEVNQSERQFQEMFAYYLKINNYSDEQVDEDELSDDPLTVESLGDTKMDYELLVVPSISLEQVLAYKAHNSNDPNVVRRTALEQASMDRYYFDQSIPEDPQLERRAANWASRNSTTCATRSDAARG